MDATRKFWFVLIGAILTLAVIACSCNSIIPAATPTLNIVQPPPPLPSATMPPATVSPPTLIPPTALPSPTAQPNSMGSLAGSWQDPDTGTVSTIIGLEGGYTIDSVINPDRGGNEYASSTWANGILTWTYCVPGGACVTTEAVPGSGDSLATKWSNDGGATGSTTLQRVASAPALSQEPIPGLAGRWLDPDTSGTYHLIVWENNEYIVAATLNPNRGGNEITKSSWLNNVLMWTYCVPNGACVTTTAAPISVDGGSLSTTWTNDQGGSGATTMESMP